MPRSHHNAATLCVLKAMTSQGVGPSWPVLHRKSHGNSSCSALQILAACTSRCHSASTHACHDHILYPLPLNELQQALHTFDLPMDVIVTHMAAVSQLASVSAAAGGWRSALLANAERLLRGYVGGGGSTTTTSAHAHATGGDAVEASPGTAGTLPGGHGAAPITSTEARAAAAVFTVGQAAALGGTAKAPGGLVVLVQALTAQRLAPPAGAAHAGAPADGTPVPGPLQVHSSSPSHNRCANWRKQLKQHIMTGVGCTLGLQDGSSEAIYMPRGGRVIQNGAACKGLRRLQSHCRCAHGWAAAWSLCATIARVYAQHER
jgi:hypothetical protein